jgi:hypothetical protein
MAPTSENQRLGEMSDDKGKTGRIREFCLNKNKVG